ncbi:hypothetical protein [Terriglobus tenax]|uniref:hypothetical protein n=1 Tax=Terriglobus tenax TaxID=1111115 RepID=UPI0021DFD0DE|nr:hypothetical protein [Terriglobus tenax]
MILHPATATCPNCGQGRFHRRASANAWQRYMCQIFRLFPWECDKCARSVYSRDRGDVRYNPKVDGLSRAAVHDRVIRSERSDSWAA